MATARAEASHTPIIVRAATQNGVHLLFALGAQHVIYPELEGGLEMTREALTCLGYPEMKSTLLYQTITVGSMD
ncbi:MAG TPA: hypothetical protein VED37_15315 [Ktedonobacteraceae bacterium]|nr:hypothetical protein [Ktedonobacteraceae bacterium]